VKSKNRPDIIVFVMAYLSLLGVGALFGGLIVFVTVIPAIQEMGRFFHSSAVMMVLLGIFALLLVVLVVFAMLGLWQGKRAGRVITTILTAWAALVSGLSIPLLSLVGLGGIALYVPLGTAATLFITSSGTLWSLTRPSILNYFNPNA
jgi:hypothetical protein